MVTKIIKALIRAIKSICIVCAGVLAYACEEYYTQVDKEPIALIGMVLMLLMAGLLLYDSERHDTHDTQTEKDPMVIAGVVLVLVVVVVFLYNI